MKNLPKRLSVAAGLAVATMMTSSAVAFAATAAAPFTVTAGSSVTGVANVTGAASGTAAAPAFRLLNTITGATVNCVAAKLAGTATLGPSTGANLIQLNSSSYGGCTIVIGGSTFAATVNQLGTWHFNGTSTSGGLTTGVVSSVAIKVTSAACSFTAAGNSDASYTNSSTAFNYLPGSNVLNVGAVGGCAGQWLNGHTAWQETLVPYLITTNLGPLAIF